MKWRWIRDYQQGKATFDAQSRAFHSFVSGFYMAFMAAFWCPTFKNLFSDAIPWFNGMVLKLEMSTGNQFRYWESSFPSIPTCMWPMHAWLPKALAKPPSKSFFQKIQTSSRKTSCRNLITMLTTLLQSLPLITKKKKLWVLYLGLLFMFSRVRGVAPRKCIDVPFSRNYVPTWVFDRIKSYNGGYKIQLILDKCTRTIIAFYPSSQN